MYVVQITLTYLLLLISTSSLSLRVFDDPTTSKMWKASVRDVAGEILCVSQFTLMANTMKSNKPDFHLAMVILFNLQKYKRVVQTFRSFLANRTFPSNVRQVLGIPQIVVQLGQNPRFAPSPFKSAQLNFVPSDGRFGAMMSVSLTNEVRLRVFNDPVCDLFAFFF